MTMLFMSPSSYFVTITITVTITKKGQHKQHCLHTYNNCIRNVVSVVLFLFSVVVSLSKTQPHLKQKLVISKHKLVILTQLSLCLKKAEWRVTEKF